MEFYGENLLLNITIIVIFDFVTLVSHNIDDIKTKTNIKAKGKQNVISNLF